MTGSEVGPALLRGIISKTGHRDFAELTHTPLCVGPGERRIAPPERGTLETTSCTRIDRASLRVAALTIIDEVGIDGVTLERLSARTGVPIAAVRVHYPSATACVTDAYEQVSREIYEDFARCLAAEPRWRRALMLASRTLLARLAAHPSEARLCFVEILRADRELLRRRDAGRRRLVDLLVAELGRRRDHPEQFRVQLELLLGAGFQAIAAVVEAGATAGLPELASELESRALVFEPVAA